MQKPLKKIHRLLIALSGLCAGLVTLLLYSNIYPYQLIKMDESWTSDKNCLYFFHDLDKDGFSEMLEIENHPQEKTGDIKIYFFSAGKKIINNQYNFFETIAFRFINFEDITNDGVEEIFVFSLDENNLYLSVINYTDSSFLIRRQPLIKAPQNNQYTIWDADEFHSVFLDINNDGVKEMIFSVHSGLSMRPRGIFAFDLMQKKIIREFTCNAGAPNLFAADINADGREEIIVSTVATANFRTDDNYTDKKSWLFVFNQKLQLLFPAIPFGNKYTGLQSYPVAINGRKYILSHIQGRGEPAHLYIINEKGEKLKEKVLPDAVQSLFINYDAQGEAAIHINFNKIPEFHIYDSDFSIKEKFSKNENEACFALQYLNLTHKAPGKIAGFSYNGAYIKDLSLNTLAYLKWNRETPYKLSVKRNGQAPPQLAISTDKFFYLLDFSPNKFYPYLPFLFIVLLILFYGIFFLLNSGVNKIKIYLSYFLFSLKDSDNAILLLSHKGRILSINHKVESTLRLDNPIHKKQHFKDALQKRMDVCEIVDESLITQQQIKKEITFEDAHSSFIGEVSVTPFFSFFKFANAYLVEIKDSTHQVLADRQSNWQRTVRKMVHDIKNPLGGVQLKLQTIYLRLSDAYPEAAEDLQQDMETANAEIKRIRNISKDFLKFSDLDSPQFKPVNIKFFMNRILRHFVSFQNEFMTIKIQYGETLPDEINIDERQTELLMHILVENAIDALKGKGKIEINIDLAQNLSYPQNKHIRIQVKDNGPGIPMEFQQKIFEPHFSTKTEGTGMGLVFAKHIVQQHGGELEFKSTNGASFTVILPLQLNIDN